MATDFTLVGGLVVDGTGAPGRVADVGVRDGRIVHVGPSDEPAGRVVDVTGLVVAPGFVDPHTHYDAQITWDAAASPAPLHGVTSLIAGNCGFSLAPVVERDVDYLSRMMARVEGIPLASIQAAVPWNWRSFGEYLANLDGSVAVNAGFITGHSALRRAVMGEDSIGGVASDEQIAAMVALLRAALADGSLGFSTSRSSTHFDGEGNRVPSCFATPDEVLALARVVGERDGTILATIMSHTDSGVFSDVEMGLTVAMSKESGCPINWNAIVNGSVADRDSIEANLAANARANEAGAQVTALLVPIPQRIQLTFTVGSFMAGIPNWGEVFKLPIPERREALKRPEVRQRMREGIAQLGRREQDFMSFEEMTFQEVHDPELRRYEGRKVRDVAAEEGGDYFDVLLDVVVADGLRTGLEPKMQASDPQDWDYRAELMKRPTTVVGGSDAGAHLDLFCNANITTTLLGEVVRDRGELTLEEGVRQITDVPARANRLKGRGRIARGWAADITVFDAATVGAKPWRTVSDLPGGASRLHCDAIGIDSVYVNGVPVVRDGALTGQTPGTVLRSGIDTE